MSSTCGEPWVKGYVSEVGRATERRSPRPRPILAHRDDRRLRPVLWSSGGRGSDSARGGRVACCELHRGGRCVADAWRSMAGRPTGGDLCGSAADAVAVRAIHRAAARPHTSDLGRGDVPGRGVGGPTTGSAWVLGRVPADVPGDLPRPSRGPCGCVARRRWTAQWPRGGDQAVCVSATARGAAVVGAPRRDHRGPDHSAILAVGHVHRGPSGDLRESCPAESWRLDVREPVPDGDRDPRARRALWLGVPLLWPLAQPMYKTASLPALSPFLAIAWSIPVPGLTLVGVVIEAIVLRLAVRRPLPPWLIDGFHPASTRGPFGSPSPDPGV
jgi:hypothetical protein